MLKQTTKLNIHTLPVLQPTDLLSTFKGLASSQENHRFAVPHAVASKGFMTGSHPACVQVLEEIHISVFSYTRCDH